MVIQRLRPIGLLLAVLLAGCGLAAPEETPSPVPPAATSVHPATPGPSPTVAPRSPSAPAAPPVPSALPPLVDPALDLLAGPVAVPLQLLIPALDVSASVLGVGLTADYVMDAPKGPIDDPIWQSAYWYRGSGSPGDSGTAVIAAHVNDPLSRPAIFARLTELVPGDSIILRDSRTGRDLRYVVTRTALYSLAESADPAVLAQIYGPGPAAGLGPQPSPDGLAYLTLITCAGSIVNGEFDHHVVVFATLSP